MHDFLLFAMSYITMIPPQSIRYSPHPKLKHVSQISTLVNLLPSPQVPKLCELPAQHSYLSDPYNWREKVLENHQHQASVRYSI